MMVSTVSTLLTVIEEGTKFQMKYLLTNQYGITCYAMALSLLFF